MNTSAIIALRILVERAVRPVRASVVCKRKMREELLAHVTNVFETERANLRDEKLAVELTARRLGNCEELSQKLQESVPRGDWSERLVERLTFRPGETTWRRAVRHALLIEISIVALFILLLALNRQEVHAYGPWWQSFLYLSGATFVSIAAWTFLVDWTWRAIYSPAKSILLRAVLVAGACIALGASSQNIGLFALILFFFVPALVGLAKVTDINTRYYEEWDKLEILESEV